MIFFFCLFYSILFFLFMFCFWFYFFSFAHLIIILFLSCLRILFTSWSVTGYIYSRLLLLRHFLQLLLILMSCAFLPNIHYTIISAFLTDLLHYLVFHSLIMQMLIESETFFYSLVIFVYWHHQCQLFVVQLQFQWWTKSKAKK